MAFESKKIGYRKLALIAIGILFLSSCVTIVVLISVYYDSYSPPNDYAIVFDAGSSSTKMYIYYWKGGLSASMGDKVTIEELTQCTKSPGIDRLGTKNDVILYFNDCLQLASRTIPESRKRRTYITLAATAGMRLLNISDSAQAEKILNYTREHFSKTEFLYNSNDQVKIINGKEEGVYAWISVNYFADKFSSTTDPVSTYGILDLGGASNQLAFVPKTTPFNSSLSQFYENLKIYGVNYTTFSSSHLCWGVNQILLVYQTNLIIKSNYSSQINGSCFHKGTSFNFTKTSILNSNCANGNIFAYPNPIDLDQINQKNSFLIEGTSDPVKCAEEVLELFPDTECIHGKNKCSFNNLYQPELTNHTKIYAFSNYYLKIFNTEILSKISLKKDMLEYKNQTRRLCSLDYQELSSINNKTINDEFLRTTCFYNYYVLSMLAKFRINNFDNVEILGSINRNAIGWSLGYLINQINREDFLPIEQPSRRLKADFFIPLITVSSVFTLIAFIALSICIFSYF